MPSPTLVKFEINGDQAKAILDQQFLNMILKLTEARGLLAEGKFKRAYAAFPYHDPLGANLEEFVSEVKDTNPNL